MTSNIEKPDTYSLAVLPNLLRLGKALLRPSEPFIMINLLVFKDRATGDYSHLSGREAYELYAGSVETAQTPLGSRMLWMGEIQKQIVGVTDPVFQIAGLLEYASPKNFLRFAAGGNSESKARSAGLMGQWLISATTLELNKVPPAAEGHIILFEMYGYKDDDVIAGTKWRLEWRSACQEAGARTIWRGKCDQHVLGKVIPKVDEVLVTWFPSAAALEQTLADHEVAAERKEHKDGLQLYLAYTATSVIGMLTGLN